VHSHAAAQTTESQEQSTAVNAVTYKLAGKVVDSVKGQAIRGALVQLSGSSQGARLTDADGRFEFEGLRGNTAAVTAMKPGFYSEQAARKGFAFLSGQSSDQPIIIALGSNTPDVIIKLVPAAVIFGRATGIGGEPIESLQISVITDSFLYGRKLSVGVGAVTTDEDGNFKIPGLLPGNYYVRTGVGPERVIREPGQAPQQYENYAPTFFPGVPIIESAAPIMAQAGTRTEANFSLEAQPFYRISGAVSGFSAEESYFVIITNAPAEDSGERLGVSYNPATGAFTSPWLPRGTYRVSARAQSRGGAAKAVSQTISLQSNISGLRLAVQPLLTIPLKVQLDSTKAAPSAANAASLNGMVTLWPVSPSGQTQPDAGTFSQTMASARSVEPGRYEVKIVSVPGSYVKSAMYGSQDLIRDDVIRVEQSGEVLEVVWSDDGAVLSGTITSDGRNSPGAVLVISEESPGHTKMVQSNQDGAYQVTGLAPGTYRAVAFDEADDLEYGTPSALSEYLSSAQTIQLNNNQTAHLNIELIKRSH
jgi:hypothetical protein